MTLPAIMPGSNDPSALLELFVAIRDETATADQLRVFEDVLRQDVEAGDYFARFMQMHVLLQRKFSVPQPHTECDGPPVVRNNVAASVPIASPPFLAFLGKAAYGTVGYFSSGWPLAYLVATLIFGIGLFIGSLMPVARLEQVARQSSVFSRVDAEPKIEPVVGRITGMVDCKWGQSPESRVQSPALDPRLSPLVSLGDRFALASGLMEITYGTGAKVILQGPVTYVVESAAGGFLSLGKVTARVEKKAEESNPQSLIPNPSSLSTLHSPLFSVRTPTATVTDLGTEFGVEVEQSGVTESHVFAGKVKVLALAARNGPKGREVTLGENESVRVEKSADVAGLPALVIRCGVAKPDHFVRAGQLAKLAEQSKLAPFRRWQAYSRQLRQDPSLVAYYPFETVNGDSWRLSNAAADDAEFDGRIEGPRWTSGRFPGKVALQFRDFDSNDKVVLPHQERFNFTGPFSVAVWFKLERFTVEHQALVTKGDHAWRLQRSIDDDNLVFGTNHGAHSVVHRLTGRTGVADGRWHLAVAVYEPSGATASKRLYLDGRLDVEEAAASSLCRNDQPVWLGNNSDSSHNRAFCGCIDEVAIFARGLSAEKVQELYRGGSGQE